MKYTRRNLLLVGALLLVTLPSAYPFQLVGVLFGGDLLLGALAIFGFAPLLRSWRLHRLKGIVWLILLFPLIATFLDINNGIPVSDMLRGGARNAVFVSAILVTHFLIERLGLHLTFWFISGFFISQSAVGILLEPERLEDPSYIAKYLWGGYLVFPLLLILKDRQRVAAAVMIAVGFLEILLFDCRGSGILWVLSGLLAGYRSVLTEKRKYTLPLLVLGFSTVIILILKNFAYEDFVGERIDRWGTSNQERADLAIDAAHTFLENILFGVGSWAHTNSFISDINSNVLVGVHSTILLFSVEYGTFGFLVSMAMLVVIMQAGWSILSIKSKQNTYQWEGAVAPLIMILVEGGYTLFMSPFNGSVRFVFGFSVGIALYVLKKSEGMASEFITDKVPYQSLR